MALPPPLDHVTPRSATTLVEQCLAHIDNELAALAESMRTLRSRRNSFARISCLPSEILATVFRHIVEDELSLHHYRTSQRPPGLVVTHVCRHWRRVALEYPSLWAFIIRLSARWIGIMLERSKKAALVVRCNISILSPDCMEQVLSQLPRIKVLHLELYAPDINRVLGYLSSQPAPLLQVFKFSVVGDSYRRTTSPISDNIFQGQVPQLRSLELQSCGFSWTSCIFFSGLRNLCLKGIGFPTTLPEFLPALRCMPGLEQLTIERLSVIWGKDEVSLDRAPLLQLRSIVLDVTIQTAIALFAHLALPDDVKISLNLTRIKDRQSFSDLFSAMDKVPSKLGPVVLSAYATFSPPRFSVQFSKSMKREPLSFWNVLNDDIRLSIQFSWDSYIANQLSITFDICRMATQSKIRSLSVSSSSVNLEPHFWRTGSTNLPEVEEIRLTGGFIGGLLAVLKVGGTQSADIAYQSLRELNVEDVDFLECDTLDLHEIINMRRGLSVPICVLRFMDCRGIMTSDVELLEDVVEEVEWDGLEESLESETESYNSCQCPQCRDAEDVYF